jgi:hypothetical protein
LDSRLKQQAPFWVLGGGGVIAFIIQPKPFVFGYGHGEQSCSLQHRFEMMFVFHALLTSQMLTISLLTNTGRAGGVAQARRAPA